MTTTRPSRSRHRSTVRDACGRRRAPAGRVGGAVLVAGSTGTRFAMFQAGTQSVDDPDATVVPREGGRTTSMDGLKLLIADHNRFRGCSPATRWRRRQASAKRWPAWSGRWTGS